MYRAVKIFICESKRGEGDENLIKKLKKRHADVMRGDVLEILPSHDSREVLGDFH